MNLQIKHLAPYLEYELQIEHHFIDEEKIKGRLCVLGFNYVSYVSMNRMHNALLDSIKPILKSLHDFEESDIDKVKAFIGAGNWCDLYNHFFDAFFDDSQNIHNIIFQASYNILQYFFANHYDVFGLIPAGLAIDIKII